MRGEILRWCIVIIVAAGAGSGVWYVYQNTLPCAHPIPYALGSVDARFGVSNDVLLEEMRIATDIWDRAAGKPVFVYDPTASLKVSLVYDEREENAIIGRKILRQEALEEEARARLDTLQSDYREKQSAYNQKVAAINARGGATRSEAVALSAERASLTALADSLNAQVAVFNASVAEFNATVQEYNQTAGRTFEAGQYSRDASGEQITIFEFIGSVQLERVLAHEFGHALGLDHNEDPKSIMYAKNESGNLSPTPSDLGALRALCNLK